MPTPNDQAVGVANISGGLNVRTVEVTKSVAGVDTTVEQQVVSLADSAGVLMDTLMDRGMRRMTEFAAIVAADGLQFGLVRRHGERLSPTDRRGAIGRGSTR